MHEIYVAQVHVGVLRDPNMLDLAVSAPFQELVGLDPFPTLAQKAGKLLDGIQRAQAYSDGNKRLAWLAALVLLEMNGQTVCWVADTDVDRFVRGLAGRKDGDREAANWLNLRMVAR